MASTGERLQLRLGVITHVVRRRMRRREVAEQKWKQSKRRRSERTRAQDIPDDKRERRNGASFNALLPITRRGSESRSLDFTCRANQPIGLLNQRRQSFHQQKRNQHAVQRAKYTQRVLPELRCARYSAEK